MTAAWTAAAAAAVGWVLVGAVRVYARTRVVDLPSARSSHSVPTPRGGGLGMVVATLAVFAAAEPVSLGDWRLAAALAALVLTAGVGWWDDHGSAPIGARLVCHVTAGALVVPLALTAAPRTPAPLAVGLALWWVFWTVSSINVVNFIDGVDGLIGAQAVVFGASLAWLAGQEGAARAFGAALAGASAGFLTWNWAPAKIFMGDVGSGAIGAAAVVGGALLLQEASVPFVAAFMPLFPIFLDATVTMARRRARGEKLTVPHRSHLYQRLANERFGHGPVSALYALTAAAGAVVAARHGAAHWTAWVAVYCAGVVALGGALERLLTRRASVPS